MTTRLDIEYTDQLAELMVAKVETLQQLCQLARQQSSITQTGDATLLLSFLARKQPLMDRLTELGEQLAVYHEDDPEARRWRSGQLRDGCREAAQRCQHLLAEIVLLEKQSLDEMSDRRDAMAAQLEDTRCGSLAHHAYRAASELEESTLDLSNG